MEPDHTYPRFTKDFIGIGHELERKRQDRKKAAEEERIRLNRVLYLQKEQSRAERMLLRRREQMNKIVSITERQEIEAAMKEQLKLLRQREIDRLKQQNKMQRIIHKQAKEISYRTVQERKSQDYSRGRQAREKGETHKHTILLKSLEQKRMKANSVLESHQKAKQKIDRYFKRVNKMHTLHYHDMIRNEEETTMQKIHTIKQLQLMENQLTKKLHQKSERVSQVQQLILHVSRSQRCSRLSQNNSSSSLLNEKDNSLHPQHPNEVEENIQPEDQEDEKEGHRQVHRRKKNRHKNRYQEYQLF